MNWKYIFEILSFYLNTISTKRKKKKFIKVLRDQERSKGIHFYLFISKIYFPPQISGVMKRIAIVYFDNGIIYNARVYLWNGYRLTMITLWLHRILTPDRVSDNECSTIEDGVITRVTCNSTREIGSGMRNKIFRYGVSFFRGKLNLKILRMMRALKFSLRGIVIFIYWWGKKIIGEAIRGWLHFSNLKNLNDRNLRAIES